jgi:hypothetical protein
MKTLTQVANELGLSPNRLYYARLKGQLPEAKRVGAYLCFDEKQVETIKQFFHDKGASDE